MKINQFILNSLNFSCSKNAKNKRILTILQAFNKKSFFFGYRHLNQYI